MLDEDLTEISDLSKYENIDMDTWLHQMLKQVRILTNSDAGSIYIKENDYLLFKIFQNDSLSQDVIDNLKTNIQGIRLSLVNDKNLIAVEACLASKMISIDDIYNSSEFNFVGTKAFDNRFGYKTHSVLATPLIHPLTKETVGVIQLINKLSSNKNTEPFCEEDKKSLYTAGSFVSLIIARLQEEVINLEAINHELYAKVKAEIEKNREKDKVLFHQTKMASMGSLMTNIAHYWRQPLSLISTIASGLELKFEHNMLNIESDTKELKKIVETTNYLSQIINSFGDFFSNETEKKTYFLVSEAINKAYYIIKENLTNSFIDIRFDIESELRISSLKNELAHAILSILENAKDAILSNNSITQKVIFVNVYSLNGRCIIDILDNAGGIADSVAPKIFEPYFSTKNKLKDKKIGLFLTRSIVNNNLFGEISFENKHFEFEDKDYVGALFRIDLPLDYEV